MFNIVIITIGALEFILGCIVSVFSKSSKIGSYTTFLYDDARNVSSENLKEINRCVGENMALAGSLYCFFGAMSRYFQLSSLLLILLIGCIEIFSYRRIGKGIKQLIDIHDKQT